MRRETRKHESTQNDNKSIFYITGSILGIGIIAFVLTFVLYGNQMEKQSAIGNEKIAQLMQEAKIEEEHTEAASTQMGKTVEESKNEISNNINLEDKVTTDNKVERKNIIEEPENKINVEETSKTTNSTIEKEEKLENKEINFIKPVDGEISKKYAKETLVYSDTLQEWTTHLGLDIKTPKTTVVKASETGKIKSIKNDPRYGLSIIIEHQDGYETLYSNLLTSEFVQVGEQVNKGQSIGTVGDTATFEIIDEPHLHFEIKKDGENVDPTGLIK